MFPKIMLYIMVSNSKKNIDSNYREKNMKLISYLFKLKQMSDEFLTLNKILVFLDVFLFQ